MPRRSCRPRTENLTSGLERAAVTDLLEVLVPARVDGPIQVVGTYDRAVERLSVPGRPVWGDSRSAPFGPYMVLPIPGSPARS